MTEKKDNLKREKWSKFCPKCGKQTDEFFDSLCKDCFKRGITLLAPERLVSVSVCPHCGGFFKGKEQTSIEPAVEIAVRKAIRKKYGAETPVEIAGLSVELAENKRSAHVSIAVKAEIKGVDIEETGEFAAALKRAICDRCSRIAGGYYAAIVQIRAEVRIPTDEELAVAENITYSSLGESDFVSKERMLKEGLDIYVSSAEYGRRISRTVVKELGGSFSESKKLYGRKDGRDIYRVTFLVRLPGFKQGEIVKIGNKKISVERVREGKGIEGVDMNTGEPVFVSKKEMMKAKRI
ncbi:MAG: NMD3-related protein [Euryarchaeota archaeon]|nr:NMD3-related protein [Euryarchaeota archaeon]